MKESGRLRYALAGLQAGVLGATAMLAVFLFAGRLTRRPVWLVPNLLATTFHGAGAYTAQFTTSTLTGVAFLFVLYGLLGAAWGLLWKDRPVKGLWMGGAVAGYLVYLLFSDVLWKWLNPYFTVYAPEMQLRVAHVIWGALLGQSPRYAASIGRALNPPEPAKLPEPDRSADEPPPLPGTI